MFGSCHCQQNQESRDATFEAVVSLRAAVAWKCEREEIESQNCGTFCLLSVGKKQLRRPKSEEAPSFHSPAVSFGYCRHWIGQQLPSPGFIQGRNNNLQSTKIFKVLETRERATHYMHLFLIFFCLFAFDLLPWRILFVYEEQFKGQS